jgi:hypothetical protein
MLVMVVLRWLGCGGQVITYSSYSKVLERRKCLGAGGLGIVALGTMSPTLAPASPDSALDSLSTKPPNYQTTKPRPSTSDP